MSLAVFGQDSAYVTALPEGPVGDAALSSLRYFGVNTDRVIRREGRMGLYYLEKGASQRPSKVIYDRAYSAISRSQPEEYDWDRILDGFDWFHWTGINPALSDSVARICLDACRAAKAKGITVSCDLNYRKNLWSSEKARSVMPELMPYIDVCIANEEDADMCLGIRPEDNDVESGKLNRAGYEVVASEICRRYGCRKVAVTLRESYSASVNGWSAMLYDGASGTPHYSKKYDIQLVDRVGGGDSFAAGLIYGLGTGKSDQDTIEFAAAASCLKQTLEGDFNRETVSDVENLLKSGGSGRVQR